jgi:hypothetical protein
VTAHAQRGAPREHRGGGAELWGAAHARGAGSLLPLAHLLPRARRRRNGGVCGPARRGSRALVRAPCAEATVIDYIMAMRRRKGGREMPAPPRCSAGQPALRAAGGSAPPRLRGADVLGGISVAVARELSSHDAPPLPLRRAVGLRVALGLAQGNMHHLAARPRGLQRPYAPARVTEHGLFLWERARLRVERDARIQRACSAVRTPTKLRRVLVLLHVAPVPAACL